MTSGGPELQIFEMRISTMVTILAGDSETNHLQESNTLSGVSAHKLPVIHLLNNSCFELDFA